MSEAVSKQTLTGWGGMNPEECDVYRPEKNAAVTAILEEAEQDTLIARGLGRSYGDTSVNGDGGVINMSRLNRMLDFDADTGILHCESGVSLAEIVDTFLPRGYFVPVTPGTKHVTVGGAIANDVHGKNHHNDGTFGEFVESFELMIANGDVLNCSREENSDVFFATTGGVGLTGIILSAYVRLFSVESAYMQVDYRQCKNLNEALKVMAETDEDYQYSVAWVDCLARGENIGRSVMMQGNHATVDQLPIAKRSNPFHVPKGLPKFIPFNFPGFVLNPLSIKAFNFLFYNIHRNSKNNIVDYDKYFYPLDQIGDWNRMYGKHGFGQFQATVPPDGIEGLAKMLRRLADTRRASFLAVLKTFGEGNDGLLSHPMKGFTLTLDIPNRNGMVPFLKEMDEILIDHGGRLYLGKDMVSEAKSIAAMYPRLEEFKTIVKRLDPEGRFSSTMARRLGLTP